ncbi:fibronectin type III domain-containing protein [Salinilacihabitans rarus]|uniref:fibronectin type III domain-containing protein n=1 Tax=Salinilacihabitans rarus TaxID=2961596 RepID=UPI0020C925F0|nr:fibronectin type III domain-containing protein [Salinilacihabitans rarus]
MFVAVLALSAAFAAPVAGASTDATTTATDEAGPSVDTLWADYLSDEALIVAGNLTDLGDADEATVRFEYRANGTDEWAVSDGERVNATGTVTEDLTGLEPGTEYEYRAVAETAVGVDRGETRTIETLPDRPAATTVGAENVTEDGAVLVTNVTDLGGADSATVWFSYSPTDEDEPHSDWTETDPVTVTSTGLADRVVDGLEPGTEYEFTSHIDDGDQTGYSAGYETFTTDDPFVVATGPATDVSKTGATLTGEVVDFGGADGASAWFEYRASGADEWATTEAVAPDSAAGVSAAVDALEPGTTYEFRVVAEATDGDADVGAVESFETLPDPAVETGAATAVDDASATVAGDLVDLGGADAATVAVQYRAAGESAWVETDGETLTAPGAFDASLTGLEPETEYEYRAVVRADGVVETGATATLTTDVAEHDPTVEELAGVDESSSNPHAELAVDWAVADADGDLSSVAVTIRDGDGRVVDAAEESVAGDAASGSFATEVKHGAGDTYRVTLEVADGAGNVVVERTEIGA